MSVSDQKHRNGFISNNNAVQVNSFDRVAATYGASNFGEKGVANHGVLKSMFSMPDDFSDRNLSKAILSGRSALETGPLQVSKPFQEHIRINVPHSIPESPFGSPNSGVSPVVQEGRDVVSDFEEESLAGTPLEGAAFNPDFAAGSVSFFYNNNSLEINKSKDGIVEGTLAPNAAFAKQGLEDPEKQVDYVAPLDGQGGFGNDANANRTSPISGETISKIIQRY